MNCEEWFERLYQILDRDLDESLWLDLERHMRACRPCLERFEFEKRIQDHLKKSCCEETCTESIRVRIRAIIEESQD